MSDPADRLNYRKMARLVSYLVPLLQALDQADLPPSDHDPQIGPASYEAMTLPLELSQMRRAFGPYLPHLRRRAGVKRLAERTDLDRIAKLLVGSGL